MCQSWICQLVLNEQNDTKSCLGESLCNKSKHTPGSMATTKMIPIMTEISVVAM